MPATLPATAGTNITGLPGANITGTIPAAALGNVDLTGLEADIALLAFKTQANGSLARYNLLDQSVDAFEDASGVDASASTGEIRDSTGNYYSGGSVVTSSGGTKTTYVDGGVTYTIHTFLTTSTYTVDTGINHDILIVAGGGGGAGNDGAAGGAGGVRQLTAQSITAGPSHAITVGAGGAGVTGGLGGKGGTSSVVTGGGTLSATGGGGGGGENNAGATGGSGGGGGGVSASAGGAGNEGSYSPAEGYAGGSGVSVGSYGGGGGGGASEVGQNATSPKGGDGGDGIQNAWQTSSNQWYGGGGGGSGRSGGGAGGQGGGGAGGVENVVGIPGTANTGGGGGGVGEGGGGGPSSNPAGSGGTGIVILRYGASDPGDMSLVSNSVTAQAQPTKGDVVLTYTNGAGTATINTDLIASVSRDNGTTYTAVTLALQGTTGGHTILTANDVDISGQPAGTSMRWKVATANQSVSKNTRIHAVSLGWS